MVQRFGDKGVDRSRSVLVPNWVDLKMIRPQLGAARLENPTGVNSPSVLISWC